MGLQVRIVVYAEAENVAFEAVSRAFEEIARLDAIMSDYRSESELMSLVGRAGEGAVPVSEDLFSVLDAAVEFARLTNGAFDITVRPLSRMWREAIRTNRVPTPGEIDSARALVSWRMIQLDPSSRSVTLDRPGMQLDLGGIAKGYAADAAMQTLARHAVPSALIEFGGDVFVGAPPPGTNGWRVKISDADSAHRFAEVQHAAIASSGDTEQFVELNGVRYSHVVDPKTGYGLSSRIAATVIASGGTIADALATALTILDPEAGMALLESHFPGARAYVRVVESAREATYSTF